MTFFVHIALDRFGAESAARALALIRGVAHESERHICVWAGFGPQPTPSDVWDLSLPQWDETIEWPTEMVDGGGGLGTERQSVAIAVRAHLISSAGAAMLDCLLRELPVEQLGLHLTVEPVVVLAGSLAVPCTSGLLLGLVAGFARLRYLGRFNQRLYVVAGTGVSGGPPTPEPERTRVLVAQAMLDFEQFMAAASTPSDRAAPVLLVGEHGDGQMPTERAIQVSIAGITIVALTRSVAGAAELVGPQQEDPFRFEVDPGGQAFLAGLPWDRARALSVVGAYAVSSPSEPLGRLIATRICRDALALLADQELLTSLEAAEREVPPTALATFLADTENIVAGRVWSNVGGPERIGPDGAREVSQAAVPDIAGIDRIFGDVFGSREWERVLANYGGERLSALPLDDWTNAVDDLTSVVEQGLLVRRRQQIVEQTRKATLNLLRGLDDAVGEIFRRAFSEPVARAPHRVAQMLLGRVSRAVSARREQIQKMELLRPSGPSAAELKQKAASSLQRFKDLLASVPSPVAVWLRMLPITGCAVSLAQLLPVGLGAADSPMMRLALGLGIGGMLSLLLFLFQVDLVRRQLAGEFGRWLSDYRTMLEHEDSELRVASRYRLLDAADSLLRWYFTGTSAEPPLPEGLRVPLRHEDAAKVNGSPDCRSRQDVLSSSTDYLSQAASRFEALGRRFLLEYQPSGVETVLPEIGVDQTTDLDREYSLVLSQDEVGRLLARVREWCAHSATGPVPWFLPFEDMGNSDAALRCPAWRRAFWMPSGAELREVDKQQQSSAFRFFHTVRSYVGTQIEDRSRLTQRLSDYEREDRPAAALQSTALGERYLNRSSPSMPVSSEGIGRAILGAGPDDRLALAAGQSNSGGAPHLSACVQVRHRLAAEEAISFPNADQPVTALGKAWRAHRRNPLPDVAFKPIVMPGDEVA